MAPAAKRNGKTAKGAKAGGGSLGARSTAPVHIASAPFGA
jgi:hypothetical protein